jgi:hypothetical protein
MTQGFPTHDVAAPPRGPLPTQLVALAIALLTAVVFAGSFFAGRSARPRDFARAASAAAEPPREQASSRETADAQSPGVIAGETAARLEPDLALSRFTDFDLDLLHPDVAAAVVQARDVQTNAIDAAIRGRAAARAARDGAPGTSVITYDSGDIYEGEVAEGVGRQGVGVYTWANQLEDSYAGEFASDAIDGVGVKRWSDGATYFGNRRVESREGYGVFAYPDGGGYEGAWRNGAPDGHGVVWNADGSVSAQGLWAGNTLVEAWIIPPPGDDLVIGGDGDAATLAAEVEGADDAP